MRMCRTLVYIGAYSDAGGEGIYPFRFDPATGALSPAGEPVALANPSYLALRPDGRRLYAVMETARYAGAPGTGLPETGVPETGEPGGGVAAFGVDEAGALTFLNAQPTGGADPCYLSVNRAGSLLLCANYTGGSMAVFPLAGDGTILPRCELARHAGSGPVAGRQEGPHVHFTDFTPGEEYAFAVDLGIDAVRFYRLDQSTGRAQALSEPEIRLRPGSGPRHMAFCPQKRTAYLITELSCEIVTFACTENFRFTPVQTVSTLPEGVPLGENSAAALHLSPDGGTLYASTRGHDSIAVFRAGETGLLEPRGCFPSGGNGPRDFALAPGGKFLLAANEKSGTVDTLRVDPESGALSPTGLSVRIYRPSCVRFFAARGARRV